MDRVTENYPTFKLEGIIKSRETMQDFEGPLTLILQLLSKNRIEIKDVKIAVILDQYLRYIDEMKAMDLEIASEFIAMASHLVYIKAKTLLDEEEEISELEALISSLKELKHRESFEKLSEFIEFLAGRSENILSYITKPPEVLTQDSVYRYRHSATELRDILLQLTGRTPETKQQNIVMPSRLPYPVGEKTDELLLKLREGGEMPVDLLLSECASRSELVAAVMAILEMCRSGTISLEERDCRFYAGLINDLTESEDGD